MKKTAKTKPDLRPVPKSNVSADYARARKQREYLEDRLEELKETKNRYREAFNKKRDDLNKPIGEKIQELQREAQTNHMKIEAAFNKKTEKIEKEILDIQNSRLPDVLNRLLGLADRVVGHDEIDGADGTVDTSVESPTIEEEVDAIIEDVDKSIDGTPEDEEG